MQTSPYSPTATVGAIVAAQPLLAAVFERVGIDYCCGGKKTLAAACAARNLDPVTFAVVLEAAASLATTRPVVDAAALSLTALADHIEASHHAYLKAELPSLVEKAQRVAAKHGGRDARFSAIETTTLELAQEMLHHMEKEERILFPLIRALERGRAAGAACGAIANPIEQMEREHADAGNALVRLRELTDGFVPDADACNTHRALFAGLARLETDLHEHVHKENNILFPRAIALDSHAAAR